MNPGFWQGKRVLLTGHTGFKGSWLSLWLQSLGANVTGYALSPPTNPSLFDVADVARGMTSVLGDVGDLPKLLAVFAEHTPEIVIHMAAQPQVLYSYQNPVETYSTNVMGTVNLLEAVRNTVSVKAVVNVTTDKCYENREWAWGYRENEPMGGHDPYSNSKGCAELVSAAYRSSFFNADTYAQHGVALAQRYVERGRELDHHLAAGPGAARLEEADMALRDARLQGKCELAGTSAAAPGAQHRAKQVRLGDGRGRSGRWGGEAHGAKPSTRPPLRRLPPA